MACSQHLYCSGRRLTTPTCYIIRTLIYFLQYLRYILRYFNTISIWCLLFTSFTCPLVNYAIACHCRFRYLWSSNVILSKYKHCSNSITSLGYMHVKTNTGIKNNCLRACPSTSLCTRMCLLKIAGASHLNIIQQ